MFRQLNGLLRLPFGRRSSAGYRTPLLRQCVFLLGGVAFVLTLGSAQAQIQQAWVARYNNGITNGTNQAVKMALDTAGNIYVTGFSQNTNTNLGYVTIKYAPNGNELWVARYDDTNYPTATPSAFALDNSNNVVVTGSALTIKYDTNGNQLWTAPYDGSALAIDPGGDPLVTGMASNFSTVKLSPVGSNLWQTTYIEPLGPVCSQVVLVDSNSNVYVAGSDTYNCYSGGCYEQLLMVKYDRNGNQLWASTYNPGGSVHAVYIGGASLDVADNLYLLTSFEGIFMEYGTFKYSTGGNLIWTVTPNYNANSG